MSKKLLHKTAILERLFWGIADAADVLSKQITYIISVTVMSRLEYEIQIVAACGAYAELPPSFSM